MLQHHWGRVTNQGHIGLPEADKGQQLTHKAHHISARMEARLA
jgi:hypothetical protein